MKKIQHKGDVNHKDFPHSKFAGYRAGCRCDLCVEANKEYKRNHMRKYRENNVAYVEKGRENKRLFRQTPKGRAAYRSSNSHRKRNVKVTGDVKLIEKIYQHCPEGYQVDHIVPVSKGGEHHEDNLQYLPKAINLSKGNRNVDVSEHALSWKTLLLNL